MESFTNLIKNLLNPRKNSPNNSQAGQKNTNPFTEIRLLTGHKDIVRTFIKIDEDRFASSSDDGNIIIWNSNTAEQFMVLSGHKKPVTCLLLLSPTLLVSGSVDRSLMFWDIVKGICIRVEPDCHESSVKCITPISSYRFCSGGNDRYLRIWENTGELVGSIERQEEENLHCMLAINNNRVITGSNSSLLLVYRTDTLKFCQIFTYHRESVRCLAKINDSMFASASLDGVIVVWQVESLTPLKRLNFPDKFFVSLNDNVKYYAHSVNHLLVINQTYLAACIGNGFQVFNIPTGESVMHKPDAHASTVYSIISIGDGKQFLTCSADAQIKLWGNRKDFSFTEVNEGDRKSSKSKQIPLQAINLGEMWGHTDQVKILLKLSETSFVSGGHDNHIILWHNGEEQSIIRTQDAAEAIQPFYDAYATDEQTNPEQGSQLPDPNRTPPVIVNSSGDSSGNLPGDTEPERSNETEDSEDHEEIEDENNIRPPNPSQQQQRDISPPPLVTLHKSAEVRKLFEFSTPKGVSAPILFRSQDYRNLSNSNNKIEVEKMSHSPRVLHIDERTGKKVKIPNYLFDKAENLMKEKQLSLAEIRQILSGEGHSNVIVEALIVELEKVTATV